MAGNRSRTSSEALRLLDSSLLRTVNIIFKRYYVFRVLFNRTFVLNRTIFRTFNRKLGMFWNQSKHRFKHGESIMRVSYVQEIRTFFTSTRKIQHFSELSFFLEPVLSRCCFSFYSQFSGSTQLQGKPDTIVRRLFLRENSPCAFISRYTHIRHEPLLYQMKIKRTIQSSNFMNYFRLVQLSGFIILIPFDNDIIFIAVKYAISERLFSFSSTVWLL